MDSAVIARVALLVLVVGLSGCMRIYADTELPDLAVRWSTFDCEPEMPDLELTLRKLDGTTVDVRTVACSDLALTFVDVTPARYVVEVRTYFPDGTLATASASAVDMRAAFNAEIDVYVGIRGNLRFAWTFVDGATCASLDADAMVIEIDAPSQPFDDVAACTLTPYVLFAYGDAVTLRLRAINSDMDVTRAVSDVVGPFALQSDGSRDLGTINLTPCGTCE
jgi:hypothetical protein